MFQHRLWKAHHVISNTAPRYEKVEGHNVAYDRVSPTLWIVLYTSDDLGANVLVTRIFCSGSKLSMLDLIPYLNHLLERIHVLLHAVMRAQVGDEVAGVHAVQAVKERVDAGVQVDQEHL